MDRFFTQTTCDRCGGTLEAGRIMSMFNAECICMKCKDTERRRFDYEKACEAELAQVKQGNMNYAGIGL